MNFETMGWIISAATGVISLVTLLWTRLDESRTAKGQLRLDQQRHTLDTNRTTSDIDQQQAETHLRITEGLRSELEAMNQRYRQTNEELRQLETERQTEIEEMMELFNKIETAINETKYNGDMAKLIIEIRRFRRKHSL
jgi:hypothetical protein